MTAVYAELAGIGKMFTVMEQQIIFFISYAGSGKSDGFGNRAELFLLFFCILPHFNDTALTEFFQRRRPDFRVPPVNGIIVIISGKSNDFFLTDIYTVMIIQPAQPAYANMVPCCGFRVSQCSGDPSSVNNDIIEFKSIAIMPVSLHLCFLALFYYDLRIFPTAFFTVSAGSVSPGIAPAETAQR